MRTVAIKQTRSFSDTLLSQYRRQGDLPADAVITAIVKQEGPTAVRVVIQWLGESMAALPDQASAPPMPFPSLIKPFFDAYQQLPAWADSSRMQRGMAFFQQHTNAIALILGCYSLPYCYLGADGAQVLWLTERIRNDTARRLQETGEWLFGVMNPKEWTNGQAIYRTLHVRLIHAASRWFASHSKQWDDAWGVPINQEDMSGTNGAFSYIVLRGLRQMGVSATPQEEEDYLHHVNVIGYLNGVAEELLPQNLREAFHLDRAIARRHFKASAAGVGLTQALLKAIAKQVNTAESWNLAAAEMRFFLGDSYADLLGVPAATLEKRMIGVVNRLPIFRKRA